VNREAEDMTKGGRGVVSRYRNSGEDVALMAVGEDAAEWK